MSFDSITLSTALSTIIPLWESTDFLETPTVSFADDPISYLIETLIASEPAWSQLPGLAPLLLREALAELEELGT
jgi:hypothetical protein